MTLLDVIIWLILIAFVVKGFTKGLIIEVCSLLSLVAGGWAAFKYYPYLAGAFSPLIRLPHNVAIALSFLLIFLIIVLVLFGGSRIPGIARSLGKSITEFKKGVAGIDEEKPPEEPNKQA